MAWLDVARFLLLVVFIHGTAESQIVRATFVSQNESGIVRSSTSRLLVQLQEAARPNSTSYNSKPPYNSSSYGVLNPSGPDPDHDNINRTKEATNASGTNLSNSTSYNSKPYNSSSYGVLNPGGPDPDHDNINRSIANGVTSGNPLRQRELVLYIWLILLHICIWYLFG